MMGSGLYFIVYDIMRMGYYIQYTTTQCAAVAAAAAAAEWKNVLFHSHTETTLLLYCVAYLRVITTYDNSRHIATAHCAHTGMHKCTYM